MSIAPADHHDGARGLLAAMASRRQPSIRRNARGRSPESAWTRPADRSNRAQGDAREWTQRAQEARSPQRELQRMSANILSSVVGSLRGRYRQCVIRRRSCSAAAPGGGAGRDGALPAAAQTGRIGGTVKDQQGQPIKGATVTAENPARVALVVHRDDRRQGPLLDHRPAVRHVEDHRVGAGLRSLVGQRARSAPSARPSRRSTSCSRPARRPHRRAGRRQHQGAPGRAAEGRWTCQPAPARRGHRRLQRDPRQDAGADDDQPADRAWCSA